MSEVEEHYSTVLAKHYTWMFGTPFQTKMTEQKAILEDVLQQSVSPSNLGLAVDLGSGPGFQSVALAEMGYSPVLAVDTSSALLQELRSHKGNWPVQTIHADILRLGEFVSPATAQVIVCMGDTITHLDSKDTILALLKSVNDALVPGGTFVLSYRDLSEEVIGIDRFIAVNGDDERVMTCFLEFDRSDSVLVHDLVHQREGPRWLLKKSSYRKLRLSVEWLIEAMAHLGLIVDQGQAGRLVRLVGRKSNRGMK
jgi:SAM-dependent methyltransferase